MPEDQPDVRPEDAVQIAQRALAKTNELADEYAELRADHEDLVEDVTALELRLSEIDDERDYDALTLDEKIGKVREWAFNKAADGRGLVAIDYDDIMWGVFDGEPGTKHCYKLMRLAAGRDEDAQQSMDEGAIGFAVRDPSDGNRHLAVNADRAKRNRLLFPENKTAAEASQQ